MKARYKDNITNEWTVWKPATVKGDEEGVYWLMMDGAPVDPESENIDRYEIVGVNDKEAYMLRDRGYPQSLLRWSK